MNLSEKFGKALGRRYSSQQMLDNEIFAAYHHGIVNSDLPLYIPGSKMILNQLYRTKKFRNAGCCALYVVVTTDPGELSELKYEQYYRFNIDRKMVDEMYDKTDTHEVECPCANE